MENETVVENKKQLIVNKIDNGIVIDHITPAGTAFFVLQALKIDNHYPHSVFVAINVSSKRLGRKDVLKIRNIKESDLNLEMLGLLIAGSNLVVIEDYKIIRKVRLETPEYIRGLFQCPGHSCITRLHEDVEPEFKVIKGNGTNESVKLRCIYCDKIFDVFQSLAMVS